jgi:hypothetical protein
MTAHQRALLDLLSNHDPANPGWNRQTFAHEAMVAIQAFSSLDLADLYVDVAFLVSAMKFLGEERWLQNKKAPNQETLFPDFIEQIFKSELSPILYLQDFLEASSLKGSKIISDKSLSIEKEILTIVKSRSYAEQKIFAARSLNLMAKLFEFENRLQLEKKSHGEHLGLSMYRTFDGLDEIFNLNYNADHGMKTDLENTERLYEGAGVGVQSGYSTVLMALGNLKLPHGARFIDLGSGYGRVGLVVGLMRPDIDFIGYEFVQHRVDIAATSSENLGLQEHVHFHTQDLSLKEFQIPNAEIYYMYDPFSEETYSHVLSQLIEISRHQKIVIVTKGNARGWLLEVARREGWSQPEEFDSGNLCLFCS